MGLHNEYFTPLLREIAVMLSAAIRLAQKVGSYYRAHGALQTARRTAEWISVKIGLRARKVKGYYRAHGAVRTVRRIAELISVKLGLRLGRSARLDGLATVILSTEGGTSDRLAQIGPLESGSALVQEVVDRVESIYEIEIRVSIPADSSATTIRVLLVSEDEGILHSERLDPRRVGPQGAYLLRLEQDIPIRDLRSALFIVLWADGRKQRGLVSVWVNESRQNGLLTLREIPSRAQLLQDLHSRDTGHYRKLSGDLVYRIAARGTQAFTNYHRTAPPPVLAHGHPALKTIFVIGDETRPLVEGLSAGAAIVYVDEAKFAAMSPRGGQDVLLVPSDAPAAVARAMIRLAQATYVPVIGLRRPPSVLAERVSQENRSAPIGTVQLAAWADVMLCPDAETAAGPNSRAIVKYTAGDTSVADLAATMASSLPEYCRRILPKISIVTILYGKSQQIGTVLDSYFRQTYRGEIEIVFVDDCGPDDATGVIETKFELARQSGAVSDMFSYKIIRNVRNSGNCVSRNVGITHSSGEIVVIIDADCMLNRDFLLRHAEAHSFGDCDVVIGPLNIETEGRDPWTHLQVLEEEPHQVVLQSKPQDTVNQQSFVNCITRNFSVRCSFIDADLFDPAFSYSADPDSGFGWEDVEMGYRLYRRGARIKYASDAFSVHITHASSMPEREKPVRSLRNFRKMIEKHPDMVREARRWLVGTYRAIKDWLAVHQIRENEDTRFVDAALIRGSALSIPPKRTRARARPLRILTYRWHVPHQYELYKLPHEFVLLTDLGNPMTHGWELGQRPLPDNVKFQSVGSVRQSDFDLAILHFDENVLSPENTNNVIGLDWGAPFRWFMENVELPKIAICHGTPQFYGQYDMHYNALDLLQIIEPARKKLVDYLGQTMVVCNSHQAQREWRFSRSRVIWHGFDPTEFPPSTYRRGILSPLGPLVMSRPHYRGYFLYRSVFNGFEERLAPSTLQVPDPSPLYAGNQFATWKYRNYIDTIRQYSIYFNPTLRSPMPRARGEPMMCGAVTVSANNHDVDMFIRNGVNGFYSNDPEELREYLLFLTRDAGAARRIGAAGRKLALDIFNHDRYLAEWRDLIRSVT